ncbi:hypothetical protein CTKZ_11370 [Cellulomonas algicola]|uniref:Uncharacterized protein n=1 Tax=Cellulomonas algicola TaxID=2071633 RepID=A0A401UY62_9CELL|nr:hypothetical protein CTKZ_11370 [Cellulomonas algicola]
MRVRPVRVRGLVLAVRGGVLSLAVRGDLVLADRGVVLVRHGDLPTAARPTGACGHGRSVRRRGTSPGRGDRHCGTRSDVGPGAPQQHERDEGPATRR